MSAFGQPALFHKMDTSDSHSSPHMEMGMVSPTSFDCARSFSPNQKD